MANASLYRAIDTWSSHAVEQRRQTAVCSKVILRMYKLRMWSAFDTWICNLQAVKSFLVKASRVVSRWQKGACAQSLLSWREHTAGLLKKRFECKRIFAASLFCIRKVPLHAKCFYRWVLHAAICRRNVLSAWKCCRHRARLTLFKSLSKWSIISISKQVDVWEPALMRTDLSFGSPPHELNQYDVRHEVRSLEIEKSYWNGLPVQVCQEDEDASCVQRALLSSYQRLESERLRRRVVLSWAAAISYQRS